jgi:hypothetical protein
MRDRHGEIRSTAVPAAARILNGTIRFIDDTGAVLLEEMPRSAILHGDTRP